MSAKKRVLLTGSSGFVGGHFHQNLSNYYDILAISLKEKPLDPKQLQNIEVVVHCAGLAHQMRGAQESEYMQVNYELTKELADEAKRAGVVHFIFLRTAHVYGDSGSLNDHQKTYNEESECWAHDPYGRSKILAEKYLLKMQEENFLVSIIRPPMIYGKGGKGNLISLAKLIQFFPILPLAFTENKRSILSVENLIYFLKIVIEKKVGGILLPQDERPVSIQDLALYLGEAMEARVTLFRFPQVFQKIVNLFFKKQATRLYGTLCLDSHMTNKKTGYQPMLSTQEALKSWLSS